MNPKYKYLLIVSGMMLLVGAVTEGLEHPLWDINYLIGALVYGLYYILAPEKGAELRLRRLANMNVLAGLLFALSAVARMGYLDAYGSRLWVLFLALGCVFMIYANLLIGRISSKEDDRRKPKGGRS